MVEARILNFVGRPLISEAHHCEAKRLPGTSCLSPLAAVGGSIGQLTKEDSTTGAVWDSRRCRQNRHRKYSGRDLYKPAAAAQVRESEGEETKAVNARQPSEPLQKTKIDPIGLAARDGR